MGKDSSGIPEWPQFSSEVMRQGPAIRKAHMTSLVRYLKERHGLRTVNVLEIGSWAGASTITWARAIKDLGLSGSVHCIDIWEPYFDLEANKAEIYENMNRAADQGVIFHEFCRNISAAGVEDIVTTTKGNSREVLPGLKETSYQIIFIDASHLYGDVLNDIVQAKRLIVDGGIICGDDFELPVNDANQANHHLMLASNVDFAADPSSGVSYHPGVSQAIADTFGDVSAWDGLWAVRRGRTSFETIDDLDYERHIPEHLQPGEKTASTELLQSELEFNIVRSQGRYIGCRQTLGPINFAMPLDRLTQLYAASDLIVTGSLEETLLRICEIKIKEFKEGMHQGGVAVLLQSNLGFNIVRTHGKYVGCRQSLGRIDFSIPLERLSKRYSAEGFIVEDTREGVLIRVCELEKLRLERIIGKRQLRRRI